MALRDFFTFLSSNHNSGRVSGPPTSSNAASSFHLWLDVPSEPLISFSATIQILEPPKVDRLFFWALQVSFFDGPNSVGAGHFGLQHYSRHPDSCAVNWGGYFAGGGELPGSESELKSTPANPNSRDYLWETGRPYRYKIAKSPRRGWQGSITDLSSGTETVVRDLHIEADSIGAPVVWTEAFAHCEEPSVAIRWSDLEASDRSGQIVRPKTGRTNYQTESAGGCSNTTFELDRGGVIQRTGTERLVNSGERIPLFGDV